MCIDPAKTYTATLATTEGDIVIELDAANAPETVNNFVVLSRYHFYDNVPFHRIVPGFVNQAGDPVGPTPGTGGPGYTIPDELPADPATAYPPGTVAMANSGPESGGSQFFLVIGDQNGALSSAGSYSVFGKVIEGQDVSEAINASAVPTSCRPSRSPSPRSRSPRSRRLHDSKARSLAPTRVHGCLIGRDSAVEPDRESRSASSAGQRRTRSVGGRRRRTRPPRRRRPTRHAPSGRADEGGALVTPTMGRPSGRVEGALGLVLAPRVVRGG